MCRYWVVLHIKNALWMMNSGTKYFPWKFITTPIITLILPFRTKSQQGKIIYYQVLHFKCMSIDFFYNPDCLLQKYESKCLMESNLYINTHPSQVKQRLCGFIPTWNHRHSPTKKMSQKIKSGFKKVKKQRWITLWTNEKTGKQKLNAHMNQWGFRLSLIILITA